MTGHHMKLPLKRTQIAVNNTSNCCCISAMKSDRTSICFYANKYTAKMATSWKMSEECWQQCCRLWKKYVSEGLTLTPAG